MTKRHKTHTSAQYRIKLKGHLDSNWSGWFGEMAISHEGGETVLTGRVADQAALHGIFVRIRDLNLTLLSVERIGLTQEEKQ